MPQRANINTCPHRLTQRVLHANHHISAVVKPSTTTLTVIENKLCRSRIHVDGGEEHRFMAFYGFGRNPTLVNASSCLVSLYITRVVSSAIVNKLVPSVLTWYQHGIPPIEHAAPTSSTKLGVVHPRTPKPRRLR